LDLAEWRVIELESDSGVIDHGDEREFKSTVDRQVISIKAVGKVCLEEHERATTAFDADMYFFV